MSDPRRPLMLDQERYHPKRSCQYCDARGYWCASNPGGWMCATCMARVYKITPKRASTRGLPREQANRYSAALCVNVPSALIEGLLVGGMAATWRWASQQSEWWHTSDLMAALGVTPQHAANYAAELTEKGLLDRERDDLARGGKRFRYRAVLELPGVGS